MQYLKHWESSKGVENMIEFLITTSGPVLLSLVGAFFSIFTELLFKRLSNKRDQQEEDITDRIKSVTDILSNSMTELDLLQKELGQRIELVEKLKKEADQAEQIISMTEEQVNAFKNTLNQELKKESKKSFWQGVLVNFIFFILGAVASYIVSKYLV